MSSAEMSATFEINLKDNTSGTAADAAAALGKLKSQISADTKALGEMQRAMNNLKKGGTTNVQQFKELKEAIKAKKGAIADAQGQWLKLGGSFDAAASSSAKTGGALDVLKKATAGLPGPLGGLNGQMSKLAGLAGGGLIAAGALAIAAALVAVTAAAVAAAGALLKFGIAAADARRSELLQIEGLTKMRNWFGIAAGNAKEMQQSIDSVSASVAIGRDKVGEYSSQLYKMGLRGENLKLALEGVAIKSAVQGEAAASAFASWAAGANMAGQSVKALTDDVKARLGGIAAKQMLSLDVQSKKLHEAFGALFSNLKVEGLLKSLNSVTELFKQNTASGRALKLIATTIFQPMTDAVSALGPYIRRFFQGMIIGVLTVGIQVLKLRNWFRATFGGSDILKGFDATTLALYAGEAAIAALGVAFVITGGLIVGAMSLAIPFLWGAVAAVGSLALAGLAMAAPFILGAIAVGALVAAGYQLYQLWKEIDWKSLGTAIVDGIVGGLKNGAKWVIDSVKSLGAGAMTALKSTLGIASPSKEFAKLGLAIPQGVEKGVEKGTPGTQRAVDDMVDVPSAGKGARGSRAGGRSVTIESLNVYATSDKPQDLAVDIKRELERILEGVAVQMGAPA